MDQRFVLDTNCIIDLEQRRTDAIYLDRLIEAWKLGKIELSVTAVSASENQPGNALIRRYEAFQTNLQKAGLLGVTELLPIAKWDVGFWDHCLWSNEAKEKLEVDIRNILFPNAVTTPPSNIEENSKWRNQMCDVLVAWACSFHGWGNLVTRDSNFHKRQSSLKHLGILNVLYPKEAAEAIKP